MDIRNRKQIKTFALERLEQAPAQKTIVLIYAGTVMAMSVLVTLVQYILGLQIDKLGGLSSIGTRSILSAIQSTLPLLQTAVNLCLGLGYVASMLRVARGQYVSPNTLRLGFDRFWSLLRLNLAEMLIYTGAAMASLYAAVAIFAFSPLSKDTVEIMTPLMAQVTALNPEIPIDAATYGQLVSSMWPVLYIFLALFGFLIIPLMLRHRMARYILIDRPGLGGFACLRESRKLMKGNCLHLLKLDFSLWWYHAAAIFVGLVAYGDQILPLLGVELPLSADAGYYLFYGIYHVLQLLLVVKLRNRIDTSYALAYDTILPKQTEGNAVVLGNIFQM